MGPLDHLFQKDGDPLTNQVYPSCPWTHLGSNLDPLPRKSIRPSYFQGGRLLCPSQHHLRPFSLLIEKRDPYSGNAVSLPLNSVHHLLVAHSVPCSEKEGRVKVSFAFSFPFFFLRKKKIVGFSKLVSLHIVWKLVSGRRGIYLMRPPSSTEYTIMENQILQLTSQILRLIPVNLMVTTSKRRQGVFGRLNMFLLFT